MSSGAGDVSIAQDGAAAGHASASTVVQPTPTNVTIWSPTHPAAFFNAQNARIFTRLATEHPQQELQAALDATPGVDETFCLTINKVIIVFSVFLEEHAGHCRKVLQMMQERSMCLDAHNCVLDGMGSAAAGIRLDQVGQDKVYMVTNKGRPPRNVWS